MKSYLLAPQYFFRELRFCHIIRNSYGIIFHEGISILNNANALFPMNIRNAIVAMSEKTAAIQIIQFDV